MTALVLALAVLASSPSPTGLGVQPWPTAPDAVDPADDVRAVRWRIIEWRDAWERRDVADFVACFHPAYRAGGLDRDGLAAQKREVFARTAFIAVELSDIAIEVVRDRATARFRQRYRSDRHDDRGQKTLELVREEGTWLIAAESFEAR